jgi:MFS family permease
MLFVCAMVCVDTLFYTALTPLLPHYVQVAGLTKGSAGFLVACYPLGMLVGALPGGLLTAKFGYRQVAVAGLITLSISTLIFGLATQAPLLFATRFAEGLAGACTWAAGLGWVATAAPAEKRGEMLGTAFGAAVIGALIGPVFGAIAGSVGAARAFAFASVVGIGLIMAAVAVPDWFGSRDEDEPAQGLMDACRGTRDRRVVAGMLLMLLPGLGLGVLDVLAPLQLHHLGATSIAIGGTFLSAAIMEAALSPLAGWLSDRLGVFAPARILLAAAVAVSLLAPVLRPASVLAVMLALGLPSFGILYTPASAVLSEGADHRGLNQGLAFGLANFAWAGGMAIAAAASGVIAEATSDTVPYAILAVICMAALAALPLAARPPKHPQTPAADKRELEYAA